MINDLLNKYIKEAKTYYSNDNEYTEEVIPNVQGYIWRANGDEKTRDSHQRMDGKFVPLNRPPTLDSLTGHAGTLPHCRCWQEQI